MRHLRKIFESTKEDQQFNFFTDCKDEVLDFIKENYRSLEMEEIDESVKIRRFNDYK